MTAFDLVPVWGHTKLTCMIAAGGEYPVFRELYERTDYGEVWEALALQKASQWSPPPAKEPERPR